MSKEQTIKLAKVRGKRRLSKEDLNRDQYGSGVIYFCDHKSSQNSGHSEENYVNRATADNIDSGRVNFRNKYYSHRMSRFDFQSTFNTESEAGELERDLFSFRRDEELMARVDATAEACGTTRAKFMRIALHDAVTKNDIVPPTKKPKQRRTLSASLVKADIEAMEEAAEAAGILKTKCFIHALERAIAIVERKLRSAHADTETNDAPQSRMQM